MQSGSPRFKCKQYGRIFKTEDIHRAYEPNIKDQVLEMAMNGSGITDTALPWDGGQCQTRLPPHGWLESFTIFRKRRTHPHESRRPQAGHGCK
jgi:hypothetical protein